MNLSLDLRSDRFRIDTAVRCSFGTKFSTIILPLALTSWAKSHPDPWPGPNLFMSRNAVCWTRIFFCPRMNWRAVGTKNIQVQNSAFLDINKIRSGLQNIYFNNYHHPFISHTRGTEIQILWSNILSVDFCKNERLKKTSMQNSVERLVIFIFFWDRQQTDSCIL